MFQEHLNEQWSSILSYNKLDHFDALWEPGNDLWFEPPNQRRGGWSGVAKRMLAKPDGGKVGVFIKRQENHVYRAWYRLFRPRATFEREFKNILKFNKLGIPSLELVYFGQRKVDGKLQAILVTRELEGYHSLDSDYFLRGSALPPDKRHALLDRVAQTIRQMHKHHIQHNCMYYKHIFAKENQDGSIDVRLIDLEKAKWRPSLLKIAKRDLGSLFRHAGHWSKTDNLRLFLAYQANRKLDGKGKDFLVSLFK